MGIMRRQLHLQLVAFYSQRAGSFEVPLYVSYKSERNPSFTFLTLTNASKPVHQI